MPTALQSIELHNLAASRLCVVTVFFATGLGAGAEISTYSADIIVAGDSDEEEEKTLVNYVIQTCVYTSATHLSTL